MHQNNESGSLISTDIYGCLPIEESYNYSAKGYIKTENAPNVINIYITI